MNIIFRNLLRRKTRTLLTILGIGVGVTVIIVLGVLADGFQAGYSSMMQGSKADLVLSQPDTMDVSYSAVKEEIGAELSAMSEVDFRDRHASRVGADGKRAIFLHLWLS